MATRRTLHVLRTAISAIAALFAVSSPAASVPAVPTFSVERCCQLCPRALDADAYNSPFLARNRHLVEGKNGWLFRSDIDLNTEFRPTDPSVYGDLFRFAEALRDRGTELVVVYLPPRGLVAPDALTPDQRSAYDFDRAARSYAAALNAFRDQGVLVPDLMPLLEAEPQRSAYFFKRDRHWTPFGAQRTARLVAEAVRRMPAYGELKKGKFTTSRVGVLRKNGSLQQAAAQLCDFRYSDQWVSAFRTKANGSSDIAPQVALVGTSFSADDAYNFRGYLQEYLGVAIYNAAESRYGFEASWLRYLASTNFQESGPRIIIWEVPTPDALATGTFYRQAVPLVQNGCEGRTIVVAGTSRLKRGSTQVLFNTGAEAIPLSREYVLDLHLSEPGPSTLVATVWTTTGGKTTFSLKRCDTKGRFVAELAADGLSHKGHLLAMDVELPPNTTEDITLDARICAATRGPRHASTL